MASGGVILNPNNGFPAGSASASAISNLDETLTFLGQIDGQATGSITFSVAGTLTASSWEDYFGSTTAWASLSFYTQTLLGTQSSQYSLQTRGCSGQPGCINGNSFAFDVTLPFTVSNSARNLTLGSSLAAASEAGGVADFWNTVAISIAVPDGLTFTSQSGFFLSEVPEPGPGLLVMVGLVLLAGGRKIFGASDLN